MYDVWRPPRSTDDHKDDIVTISMTAVGLLGLSRATQTQDMMNQSREFYLVAIQRTQDALRDPVAATKDTTLLAVLILGTYESISGHGSQSKQAWQDHVNGAAALAQIRGPGQFRTKASIRMFIMLSQSALISCILSDLPMPQTMVDLGAELLPKLIEKSPVWRVVDPIYRALQVRYDIKTGKLNNLDEMVGKLARIDDEFAEVLSTLPAEWKYRRVQLTRPDSRALRLECHVYPGLFESTVWNAIRGIRMLVLETMLEQLCRGPDLSLLPEQHRTRLAKTIKLLGVIGDAIVASVPQHFGVVSFRDGGACPASGVAESNPAEEPEYHVMPPLAPPGIKTEESAGTEATGVGPLEFSSSSGQDDNAERFMMLASASSTIIWPLYVLGMSWSCSLGTKQYIIDRLRSIHKETGLDQARMVAGMLRDKPEPATACASLLERLPAIPEKSMLDIV